MSGQQSWTTYLLFLGLFGLAGAVFFVLPEKVAEEKRQAVAIQSAEASAEDSTASPPVSAPPPTVSQPEKTLPPPPAPSPPPTKTLTPEEQSFNAAMSSGLQALAAREWDDAEEAFQEALVARPQAPEALDGLTRAQTGLRGEAIVRFTAEAEAATASEQWAEAATKWSMVLAIDPAVEKALRGRAHATELADLEKRLAFHLENPERLSSGAVLAEAESLIGKASSLDGGARIRQQAEKLSALVEKWSLPVPVSLRSDGATEVNLYRVGNLGMFQEHSLELRPGTYTLVGRRDGFRDVRQKLVVAPGTSPEPLSIRCTEEI